MASDTSSSTTSKTPMTPNELVRFVKNELDADEERQAPVSATTPGEQLPTGSTLDLSHKNIGALPAEVISLIKDKVERLALSHNPRISIPLAIGQCDRLRYLNLRWNKLKHFPEAVLSLSKLEILDISKNAIDGIPEEIKNMTNLKFLAVARNQIKRLPFALGEMNLVKLKFDENPIEFPPLEFLKPAGDRSVSTIESEKDKDMCQQVKRFMKAAALRERLKSTSEEDLSESNVETPKPPKRGVTGGRFPVRPSISGIESITGVTSDSPPAPPPIPHRSHARGISTNTAQPTRRPGPAPLLADNGASRSRSESVATSANIKNRRQGYVPRKNTKLISVNEMSSQLSARSGQTAAPALTPPHSRAPSVTSSYCNYLELGSGGESSAAVSPVEGAVSRTGLSRQLASLPEGRNSTLPTITSTKAVKRVLFMLFYLHRPMSDIVQKLTLGPPKKSALERQLYIAQSHVEELDRLVTGANSVIEDNAELNPALLASIVRTATTALKSYVLAIRAVARNSQRIIKEVDSFHARYVMNMAFSTIMESRNICEVLGCKINTRSARDTLRASQAWSSRTVTPTQPKPSNSVRRRGPTVIPSSGSVTNLRGMAPPVPLNSSSRTNTMTSMGSMTTAIPRSNDSFTSLPSQSNFPSRSNTMRSLTTEGEHDEGPDRVYFKLKSCCDLASQSLPPVRADLASRKAHADASGQSHASRYYAEAVHKCDFVVATNNKLQVKLKTMKVGDAVRYQKEFSQMTESFGRDWTNFVTAIVELANQRIDIGNIRRTLKPLQYAVKDANRTASQPPSQSTRPPPLASLHGGFPPTLNTAVAPVSGPVTPVPATPLGAALGPAVQATVPPISTTALHSPEYLPQGQTRPRMPAERNDNILPLPSYPRRQ
ncbi:Leucine-rich repeat-containing sog2 [Lecanosticta acicola]|uniref:Leucine-rich repeat-containing sog2 n=1 Tax=Lecanosticta acicola TaxID=111012 RepID=A0AAI8YZT9_9PEZI|nr:Leucine-rich repeat-containing sog2 [Lecanosticta acicola]